VDGNPDRRATSDAVVSYLGVLGDPPGRIGGMSAIFNCWSGCERDGRLQSLIIDGTATGILSELPAFTRSVISIPGMKSADSSAQFLIPRRHEREAVLTQST
jgi:hypothetical protein